MQQQSFTMINNQQMNIHVYEWLPENSMPIKGIVQIAHGMAETAKRYERLALVLTEIGYAVYAHDQRGHGQTASTVERLGDCGIDGFNGMVQDILDLNGVIEDKHEGLPHFLLGHSMGSFLTQRIMECHGELFSGYMLSGSNGPRSNLSLGKNLAHLLIRIQGVSHHSLLMNALIFGQYNRHISPSRTPFDWLSRDEKEVDKYINDPFCGEVCTARFFRDFFKLLQGIQKPSAYDSIPKHKPIYMFSGDDDPVGMYGKGVSRLHDIYCKLNIADVEFHLYPGGRHEMLNETNRDEVTADLVNWLEKHVQC
ncbi:alpha/beta hydrolase [Paenibacillus sp. IHBB 10380]|uniref:alpha/beta hydrolase n=1 Tax=Paenibacillus sp. IHBB 10380 TaxID=1566358 RepID=UPI000ACE3271|nr:alpha/beta hydrolase [Paenibacillus sp. IHBB 10380]